MTNAVQLPFFAFGDIPALHVVTAGGTEADSGSMSDIGRLIGVTEGAVKTNYQGVVTAQGTIYSLTWNWTPGGVVYLNGTTLSQTAPGYDPMVKIGVALTKNVLLVQLG